MKWPLFENNIKEKLSNHSSEIDIDNLWGNLESEVDAINNQKKKRRGFVWFLFGGMVAIVFGLGFFYWNADRLENVNLDSSVSENQEIKATRLTENEVEIKPVERGVINSESVSHDDLNLSGFNVGSVQETVHSIVNKSVPKSGFESPRVSGINQTKESKSVISEAVPTDLNPKTSLLEESNTDEKLTDVEIVEPIETEESVAKKETQEVIKEAENSTPIVIEKEEIISPEKVDAKEDLSPPNENKEDKKKLFKFAFSAQASISFTDRKLEEKLDTFTQLRALRNVSERMLETSQLGLRITVEHTSGFDLTSGINYTQINERFRYNESVITQDSVPGIQFFVRNFQNELDTIFGNVPITKTTTFNKKYYNKYRLIEVPILLGWTKKFQKVRVGAQAGIFANISMKSVGHVLKSESEDFDVEVDEIYKTNIGLSYYFGVSAGYIFRDNFELYASPFACIFSKSFTKDTYGLSQKYRLYGVNVGVRIGF